MFLQTVVADGQAELRFIEEMKARAEETRGDIEETVRRIMDDVRVRGMEAVEEYSKRYDKGEALYCRGARSLTAPVRAVTRNCGRRWSRRGEYP